jgi:hypothetical protein
MRVTKAAKVGYAVIGHLEFRFDIFVRISAQQNFHGLAHLFQWHRWKMNLSLRYGFRSVDARPNSPLPKGFHHERSARYS